MTMIWSFAGYYFLEKPQTIMNMCKWWCFTMYSKSKTHILEESKSILLKCVCTNIWNTKLFSNINWNRQSNLVLSCIRWIFSAYFSKNGLEVISRLSVQKWDVHFDGKFTGWFLVVRCTKCLKNILTPLLAAILYQNQIWLDLISKWSEILTRFSVLTFRTTRYNR